MAGRQPFIERCREGVKDKMMNALRTRCFIVLGKGTAIIPLKDDMEVDTCGISITRLIYKFSATCDQKLVCVVLCTIIVNESLSLY